MSFKSIVPLVAIAEQVGLSPFNAIALTASCLSPAAKLVSSRAATASLPRHDPCPLGCRYRPVTPVSGVCGIQRIQAHHHQNEWTQLHFTPQASARVADATGPRTVQASFLRTRLSSTGNMKHPSWLGVGYRLATGHCPRSKQAVQRF